MTFTVPPKISPSSVQTGTVAGHGVPASPTGLRRVAQMYNQASVSRRKLLFSTSSLASATYAPTATPESTNMFSFRTGENVRSIAVLIGLAPADKTSGSSAANVKLKIDDGTTYSTAEMYSPNVATGSYTPADVKWVSSEIVTGVAANTSYLGWLEQNYYARVHAVMVYEVAGPVADSSVTGVADPLAFEAGKDIYDAGIQTMCEAGTKLWQHNGSVLFSLSRKNSAGLATVTSASYVNLLDSGIAAVTAASPGFRINTQYHDSQHGDVPVEIGVYAVRTAGTGTCSVKLVDAAGTVLEETGITSGALVTGAHTITAKAAEKTDIHVKVDTGGATWRFDSVCLWEYEA